MTTHHVSLYHPKAEQPESTVLKQELVTYQQTSSDNSGVQYGGGGWYPQQNQYQYSPPFQGGWNAGGYQKGGAGGTG